MGIVSSANGRIRKRMLLKDGALDWLEIWMPASSLNVKGYHNKFSHQPISFSHIILRKEKILYNWYVYEESKFVNQNL